MKTERKGGDVRQEEGKAEQSAKEQILQSVLTCLLLLLLLLLLPLPQSCH